MRIKQLFTSLKTMQSKSDLVIEKMSFLDIKKMISDLNEKNQTLENELNVMKNCVHVFNQYKQFFESICLKLEKYMTEEESKQLSHFNKQLTDIYNNRVNDHNLNEKMSQFSDNSIAEDFTVVSNPDTNATKDKSEPIPVYRCLRFDACDKIFITEKDLNNHRHTKYPIKDKSVINSFSSESSQESKQSNDSQNIIASIKRTYSTENERPIKIKPKPNTYKAFASALMSLASIESQTKSKKQKKSSINSKTFICYYPNCEYRGNTLNEFTDHRLNAHSLTDEEKSGTNEELIVSHNTDSNESFSEWNDQNSDSLFKCSDSSCGQLFADNISLIRHKENHNNMSDSPEVVFIDSEQELSEEQEGNQFKIVAKPPNQLLELDQFVGHGSGSAPNSVAVLNTYANDRPFKLTLGSNPMTDCPVFDPMKAIFKCTEGVCGKTFKKDTEMIAHMKCVHKKNVKCCPFNGCPFFYQNKRFLWEHTNVFHKNEERPFKCTHPSCINTFITEADLNRHSTSFHGIDRYSKISTIFVGNTLSNCYSVKKSKPSPN